MNYSTERADRYIRENLNNGCKDFKPEYHFSAPVGWINDPNGLIRYGGYYHIFYQYHPYSLQWGPMHWGHARSKDLLHFEHLPVALAPDAFEESGCFSGGAVAGGDGALHLLYTRNFEQGGLVRQTQCHAVSSDGVHFSKREAAVIGEEQLPAGFCASSFRDPNPVRVGDRYYIVVGAQRKDRTGAVLVYSSRDLDKYEYEFTIENENFGEMAECPDLFFLDGHFVLTCSVIALKSDALTNIGGKANIYAVMDIDLRANTYRFLKLGSLDEGTDFYAPQSLDGGGRRLMIAWLDMWNNDPFPLQKKLVSNGVFTLPRELSLEGDTLVQRPLREAEALFRKEFSVKKGAQMPKASYIALKMREGARFAFGAHGEGFVLGVKDGRFFTERRQAGRTDVRCGKERAETYTVRLFSDRCSAEVFTGKEVFSAQAFIDCGKYTVAEAENCTVLRAASIG